MLPTLAFAFLLRLSLQESAIALEEQTSHAHHSSYTRFRIPFKTVSTRKRDRSFLLVGFRDRETQH
ncbi:hypothetical protein SD81_030925 [Tolypothrix campylonemoides VB511288]|nr:hypothetical protein SD81_030925 [Tolypothrix campylonemoides VB511288]